MTRAVGRLCLTALLGLAACLADGGERPMATDGGRPPDAGGPAGSDAGRPDAGVGAFQVVFEDLGGPLMAVAGSAADDVWAVGGDPDDGLGAYLLHYNGSGFLRVPTEVAHDLWWVHVFARGKLIFGGAGGSVLRYADGELERLETPGSDTVWGIWGAAEDDVWIVGGEAEVTPGFLWHFDGARIEDRTTLLPAGVRQREQVLFKVWGRAADDVWMVGTDGLALHWDGRTLREADSGTERRLLTVHGAPTGEPAFVAVGGYASGVIVEWSDTQWHDATPAPSPAQLFGVHIDQPGHGYAVGVEGVVLEYRDAGWNMLETGYVTDFALHSVWVDPDGGVWTVGGDLLGAFTSAGMLLYRGDHRIADELIE